jgi:hypothetical protein
MYRECSRYSGASTAVLIRFWFYNLSFVHFFFSTPHHDPSHQHRALRARRPHRRSPRQAPHHHRSGLFARRAAAHRHQRRLRRGRLRCVRGAGGRAERGGRRGGLPAGERLHPAAAQPGRQIGQNHREPEKARRHVAPRARRHGQVPRQPVRLLHTRHRDEPGACGAGGAGPGYRL